MKYLWSSRLFTTVLGIVLMTSATTAKSGRQAVNGPLIQTYPNKMNENKEVMLQIGQNFTITCKGMRKVDIRQQERREEVVGNFSMTSEDQVLVDDVYQHMQSLHLYYVDHNAVGYYACFDDTLLMEVFDVLDEPTDTQHVSYIYVYVYDNGSDPKLLAPVTDFALYINSSYVVIPCRPTSPDINITLYLQQTETPEIIKYSPKIGYLVRPCVNLNHCSYLCQLTREPYNSSKEVGIKHTTSEECTGIKISGESEYFMDDETFILNCTVPYQHNSVVELYWTAPRNDSKVTHEYNGHDVELGEIVFSAIKITNASKEDAGSYTCVCKGYMVYRNKTTKKTYLDNAYLELQTKKNTGRLEVQKELPFVSLSVGVKAYPKPNFTFYRDNQLLEVNYKDRSCKSFGAPKYFKEVTITNDIKLYICNLTVYDSGNYTVAANNSYIQKNITFDVRKKATPLVKISPEDNIIYHVIKQRKALRCEVIGLPLAKVEWIYTPDDGKPETMFGKETSELVYKVVSSLEINPSISGNVTCIATIGKDVNETTKRVLVYEKQRGFGIMDNENRWYPEGHDVTLQCLASIYDFKNLSWRGPDGEDVLENVKYYDSKLSHVGVLHINHVTMKDIGLYTCVGHKLNGSLDNESIHIEVEATRSPNIMEPQMDREYIVEKFLSVHFSCVADAVPTPDITWYKDETLLLNDTDGVNILYHRNHTFSNSTIVITRMQNKNEGNYRCDATSGPYKSVKYVYLKVQPFVMPHKTEIIGGVLATILVLIAVVIYLLWKVQKEKQFRKEQAAAGLSNFKKGVTKSLNPELGIDEQAELLPYDEKFEFPVEKLTFGKQLGAGAFGVVYKAEARGMNNAEESTPVAVKMVKKTADNMYIKALASELKIMVHLGKHINIVNLLGACTKNVDKRELIVIVEYCKFGNIHNYMQKHREVFIDQFNDNKEKNLGKVNRGYSCSSGSSAMNSDYFGTHSHATDHTLLNTANSNRSDRKVSETDYIQPEWRSNYESDYSFDGRNPRPLCSRDLLTWAFQIARGMEYLASRKILHGDLAARNVLLAEDNIVKICDFGLAKSIYKNDEYQKKENSLLPVKWLAIECMTDRIFTTQSDVWAFGIVLWEMFSLAKTPYPNMSPQHLLQWLSDGHRLEKPPYADDRLYHVMKQCWEHKPNSRPSFTQLQELLGSFLEDNVRNHYVDLNSAFMDLNIRNGGEDYLAMVSAPDYNNLVTPSPHHYVNEVNSFFPLTPTLDKEGYLQMTPMGRNDPSIFSPRNPSTKFDFDAKKLEPKVAESRGGSELTPMLTLNNLPARSGSDSDHEAGHPSYLKMRPRPYEESDDVFKLNENNERNIQNSAVTNPTYISFDLEIEKKPKENNNYTNIPNGLVK